VTWGAVYWPIALGVIFCIIFGPEAYALATNYKNTLSEWVWHWDVMNTGVWYLTFGLYIVVFSWLAFHFWLRKYT
jgi:hypothetical protein